MSTFPITEAALRHLSAADPRVANLIARLPIPRRELMDGLVPALLDCILGQQISTAAHRTLRRRAAERFGDLTPETVAGLTVEQLQSIGTSFRKAGYLKAAAEAFRSGQLDPAAIAEMEDEAAIAALTALPGVGRWTAEMLLTFSLARPDVLSWGDLGIRRGFLRLYGLETVGKRRFEEMTRKFSPYRTTLALYLWENSK